MGPEKRKMLTQRLQYLMPGIEIDTVTPISKDSIRISGKIQNPKDQSKKVNIKGTFTYRSVIDWAFMTI